MEIGVSVETAIEIACKVPIKKTIESVPLEEAANRILAIDLVSKVDNPRFDNSSMDGWAVKFDDCKHDSKLRIIGTNQAGKTDNKLLKKGEACKIMTGASMPNGADSIVIIEDSIEDHEFVTIKGPARREYIRKKGEDIKKGEIIIFAGTLMTPPAISLSATMGYSKLEVVSMPKIAIISNGDELIQPGLQLLDGQIYESNSFGIASLIQKIGGEPVRFDVVQDSIEGLRDTLNIAASSCDAIITSGGVSMGDYDLVRKIMESEGEIKFWKVLMRPGGPPLFGKWKNTPIFGLPGNPVSSHVVFTMLVEPWMAHSLQTHAEYGPKLADKVSVIIQNPLRGAPGKICLRRIRISNQDGKLIANVITHQGSGNIHSMVANNALTLLPPDTNAKEGDLIEALWFR